MQQAADWPHRLNTEVSCRFTGRYIVWSVNFPVNLGKQPDLLTGLAAGEFGIGSSDSTRVEADDVEVGDEFIREQSEWNKVDQPHTAFTRTPGIHKQVAYPFIRRRGPVHINRDSDAACL